MKEVISFDYHALILRLAVLLEQSGCTNEAVFQLRHLLEIFPGDMGAHKALADLLLRAKRNEEAFAQYKALLKLNPNKLEAAIGLANAAYDSASRRETIDCLTKLEGRTTYWEIRRSLASLLRQEGRAADALSLLQESVHSDSCSLEVVLDLLDILKEFNKADANIRSSLLSACAALLEATTSAAALLAFIENCLSADQQALALEGLKVLSGRPGLSDEEVVRTAEILRRLGFTQEADNLLQNTLVGAGGPLVRKQLAKTRCADLPVNSRRAVFLCDTEPRAREAKMAAALMAEGWEVVLLHQKGANFDLDRFFPSRHCFKTLDEALYMVGFLKPRVCHVFSRGATKVSVEAIRERPAPTVFDLNDTIEASLDGGYEEMHNQRFCVEHADGLCCRDFQVQILSKDLGFKRARAILMPDYCWGSGPLVPQGASGPHGSGTIKVALVGNFAPTHFPGDASMYEVFEKFVAAEIQVDVYPHWFYYGMAQEEREKTFPDLCALEKRNSLFRLHQTLRMEEIVMALAAHDFGLLCLPSEYIENRISSIPPTLFVRSLAGRNGDYLDAGLGIIMPRSLTANFRRFNKYGVLVEANPKMMSRLKETLTEAKASGIRERALRAREAESVFRHGKRLIEFYKSL